MTDSEIISGSNANQLWSFALTVWGAITVWLIKKRDDRIDQVEVDGIKTKDALSAHALKSAETFATKDSMRNMFQEAVRQNELGLAAVNKTTDEIKSGLRDVGRKMDALVNAVNKNL